MKILVVNDDGIQAKGIKKLAEVAKKLGEVWVVAPLAECSGMSHRITILSQLTVKKVNDFEVKDVKAYSVSGTPADCVKVAIQYIMDEKPDIVFSGINNGYNAGIDVAYSGTVAAAMESLFQGVPSMAFSTDFNTEYDVIDEYLLKVIKELMKEKISSNEIWNVNFPGCKLNEVKGIKRDRTLAKAMLFEDRYKKLSSTDDEIDIQLVGEKITEAEEGTDFNAVLNNYISIGKIKNMIL